LSEVAAAVAVERAGDVFVVRMQAEENRFNPTVLDGLEAALSEVETSEGPAALVLTGEGKFFSNGLDLEWMGGAPEGGAEASLRRVHALFARVLAFPTYTVAALNGHAFAAGAMLALACDDRVMRSDRGYFCLPEADIGLPFTGGMNAVITARLDHVAAREAMLTARRYNAEEALERKIVDAVASEEQVVPDAIERAAPHVNKARPVLAAIKQRLYADALATLALDSAE
jgi:enoyl-CoA hydratase/carnithine racemase